jgi:hypothetical protein
MLDQTLRLRAQGDKEWAVSPFMLLSQTADGRRQTADGRRQTADGRRQTADRCLLR